MQSNLLPRSCFNRPQPRKTMTRSRPRRWSIFRAMRCRWFIFQQRCDTDYFWEKLNNAIVFLDHREQLFFDYFAHFRTDYFGIIHDLPPHFRTKELLMSSFIRINLQTDSVKCIFTPFPGPRHMLTETKFLTDLIQLNCKM